MSDNTILNRIFTKNSVFNLINRNDNILFCNIIKRYLNDVESKYNRTLISEVYDVMTSSYRNEYFYKNTLLNKLLLGRHSLSTTTALTEIPINKSKADFVLINGRAIVYEIKTGLDTFERLNSQLNDYYKAFNNICVVTCESNYQRLDNVLKDTNVGICILTDNNTLSTRKKPVEDNSKLDYEAIFKILRKKEFENILFSHYSELPSTTQVNYYSACFERFKGISINLAYKFMLHELKKRNKIEIEEYKKYVPYELKYLVYFSQFKKSDYLKLNSFLDHKFSGG